MISQHTPVNTSHQWDAVVRITHWLLAACIVLNLWLTEDGSTLHEWVGYTALAVVMLRLLWGLIARDPYARLGQFLPSVRGITTHVRTLMRAETHPPGHNPLAALMIFTLWAVVIGLAVSGYMMSMDRFWGDEWLEEMHEFLAHSLYVLVPIHIAAAILMSRLQKRNLVAGMIVGKRQTKT